MSKTPKADALRAMRELAARERAAEVQIAKWARRSAAAKRAAAVKRCQKTKRRGKS